MTTLNYDQAVPYYDETRGFRPGVSERYRAALGQVIGKRAGKRILELAIGTGLIGLPYIVAGDDYVGVDISHAMMSQIVAKLIAGAPTALAQADITRALPFAADSFDVVQAVRAFHLLDDWRRCVSESRRVLKPGGHLVIVEIRTPANDASPPPWAIAHDKWGEILGELGVPAATIRHGNGLTEATVAAHIRAVGGAADVVDLLTFAELPVSCRTMVERRASRMFSNDWALPDEVFDRAVRRLVHWLEHECERADEAVARRMVFRAVIARF